MKIAKSNRLLYIGILVSFAVFLILKTLRGVTATEEEGGLWNVIQLFYVCFGIYVLISKENSYKNFPMVKYYIGFMFLAWGLSFFTFVFIPHLNISHLFYFLTVPYGVLCLLTFYFVGLRCDIRKYPIILYVAFVAISYLLYISLKKFYIMPGLLKGKVADAYYVVGLLPIIFIYTPKKLRILPFLVACAVVMMSGKRAGFLALGTILLFYFIPNDSDKRRSLFFRLVIIGVVMAAAFFVVTKLTGTFDLNMFDRLENMEEDGGSGRVDRWTKINNALGQETKFYTYFVGHGYGAVNKLVGGHAHNDFLEFFYNYGLIVFILYVLFFVSTIKECIKMYKAKFTYAKEFSVAVIVSFYLAMFSYYAISCEHITCCSACFGLILAEWYKFKYNIKSEQYE